MAAGLHPFGMNASEMGDVETDQYSVFTRALRKLVLVRFAQTAGFGRRKGVKTSPPQGGRDRAVNVFVRKESNLAHGVEAPPQ